MAEILMKAIDAVHPDPDKDQRGSYKRGMPVEVYEDGRCTEPPATKKFVIIKIPGVPAEKVRQYIMPKEDYLIGPLAEPELIAVRRRRWQIQFNELPLAAINRLRDTGVLTIKAGAYKEQYDYTWEQVKGFFLDHKTALREVKSL